MKNRSSLRSELGEAIFSAPSFLIHFRESIRRIIIKSILSKKLFARASFEFSLEATLGALPNGNGSSDFGRSAFGSLMCRAGPICQ